MVVARFEGGARFIGRLDQGQDLAAGFRTICRENSIICGWINATAFVRSPVISRLSTDGGVVATPVEGSHFLSSISGSVSSRDDQVDIRLYVECRPSDGSASVCGMIEGGEVLFCEFMITGCGEVSLVRDGSAKFKPWVQLQTASPTGPTIIQAAAPRPVPVAMHAADREDEDSELNILEMKGGDYVDHPKFGVCRISNDPVEDKISIRLSTGKQVDLSLGIMKVQEPKMVGGKRVFRLEIRRRNS